MKPQVEYKHYFNKDYDTEDRFISYWYQINEIVTLNPKRILEVGIGNGFVSKYLKERKANIYTLDFDRNLEPDIVGNLLNIPCEDESFDVITCYETLEHLPYNKFHIALLELFRVSRSFVIISLPDISRVYRLHIHIPKLGVFKKLIPMPRLKKPIHKFDQQHYWTIGKINYPLRKIINDIQEINFKITNTYRIFEHPFYRFFIMRKQ